MAGNSLSRLSGILVTLLLSGLLAGAAEELPLVYDARNLDPLDHSGAEAGPYVHPR